MTKKIVKQDFNINGMDIISMFKQYMTYKRMPYINIFEGPRLKYLFELFILHYLGRTMANIEINNPKLYHFLMRIRNSLIFRYNHHRGQITRKFSKS